MKSEYRRWHPAHLPKEKMDDNRQVAQVVGIAFALVRTSYLILHTFYFSPCADNSESIDVQHIV
jgi:hypothetical protein